MIRLEELVTNMQAKTYQRSSIVTLLAVVLVASILVPTGTPVKADDLLVDPVIDHDPEACPQDVVEAATFVAQPLADPTRPWSLRTMHLAVAVHPSYRSYAGDDWHNELEELVANASAFYEAELGIRLVLVHVDELAPGELPATYQTPGPDILDELAALYQSKHPDLDRDAVVLLFGKDVAGGLAGMAMCLGGTLNPSDHSYMFMEAQIDSWTVDPHVSPRPVHDAATKILAHELGHLLAAQHRNSNCAESAPGYQLDDETQACTLMSPALNLLRLDLSTINRLQMRGWAEYVDI